MSAPTMTAAERAEHRRALVSRFATLGPSGVALRHRREPSSSPDAGSAGKIVLPSQAYARRLAAALAAIGEDPQDEYACHAGHWHLRNQAKSTAYRIRRRKS